MPLTYSWGLPKGSPCVLQQAEQGEGDIAPHPRLLVTSEKLAQLRAARAANTSEWQVIKAHADIQIARGSSIESGSAYLGESEEWEFIPSLALAYLVANDDATFRANAITRAGHLITAFATTTCVQHTVSPDGGTARDVSFDFRHVPGGLAMILDWMYEGLSSGQKTQLANILCDFCDAVWPETTPARIGSWSYNDPLNNYWHGFLYGATLAAIAAHGDATGTHAVSGTGNARSQYHIDLARKKWSDASPTAYTNRLAPMLNDGATTTYNSLDGFMAGGVWPEGTNYDSPQRLVPVAVAFYTAFGETTFINDPVMMLWAKRRMQLMVPPKTHQVPWGDQALESTGAVASLHRQKVMWPVYAAKLAGTITTAEEQAAYYTRSQLPPANSSGGASHYDAPFADFMLRDHTITPAANENAISTVMHDTHGQHICYRTDWTTGATLFAFQSGPLQQSHQINAPNCINIWKGGFWLVGQGQLVDEDVLPNPGVHGEPYNGPLTNTVLTDDDFPVAADIDQGCTLLDFEAVPGDYVYIASQAKDAYYTRAISTWRVAFTDLVRKVCYIEDIDAFLIIDRAAKRLSSTGLYRRWGHWQPTTPAITITSGQYNVSNRDSTATLYVHALNADSFSQGVFDRIGAMNYVTEHYAGGNIDEMMVTAMRINTAITAALIDDANSIGATINGYDVRFGRSETARTSLSVTSSADEFIWFDMTPSHSFTVTENGGNSRSVVSTAQGVIRFSAQVGGSKTVAAS